jgi:hypothetical protein
MVKPARRPDRDVQLERARRARARRSRSIGAVLLAVGVAIIPVLYAFSVRQEVAGESLPAGAIGVVAFPALVITAALVTLGRRLRAKGAEAALAADTRAPVVYLRPFDVDRVAMASSPTTRMRVRPFRSQFTRHYEQRLARALRNVGPFVAIGDPTERMPQLGAARLYAADADWQRKIDELTDRAGVVVLHAGESDGLAWEVDHVVADEAPERVIVSLPVTLQRGKPSRQERYDEFRRRFGDVFPRPLPATIGENQFLYFDADWAPHLFGARGGAPPAAEPGSSGAQRALALSRLGSEFKITFAPLWLRAIVYTGGVLLAVVGLIAATGFKGTAVASCTDHQATVLVERTGAAQTTAREVAGTTCEALDSKGLLHDDGTVQRSPEAARIGCLTILGADTVTLPRDTPRRAAIIDRVCQRVPPDGLSRAQLVSAINAAAAELGVTP